jgi:hypothetical protein
LIVNRGFTPRQIARIEESVRIQATEIVDRVAPMGECDFVTEIAAALPLQIICDMMGIPREDMPQIFEWTNKILGVGDPEYVNIVPPLQYLKSYLFATDPTRGERLTVDALGIYFDYSSAAALDNSTVYGNTSRNSGGGVYHFGAYDGAPGLVVTGSTITHNTADRGGGLACYGATDNSHELTEPIVRNTIIFANTADSAAAGPDLSCNFPTGATESPGTVPVAFSLLGAVAPATSLNQTGPNLLGQDPQLGPLANNGGPTQTELPAATSPVIDKGNSFGLGSDQRGVLRPIDFPAFPNTGDGSDIGAVELQPSNAFKLGKLKRNKKKGTAKQVVILPLPDAGSVTIKGKGLKTKTRTVTGAANLKLPVIAKGKKQKALKSSGKAKIKAKVTYSPIGNAAATLKRKLKLLKR